MSEFQKPRLLSGDMPTGRLHLGHWVGSVENRVSLQDEYECYFLIANTHAFTTNVLTPELIHQNTLEIVLDYLAVGVNPEKSTIFIESEVPAIFELMVYFSMFISFPRLMRNPTIKDEIRDKKLRENHSVGFLLYPIMQVADILSVRAEVVPVGADQIPHIELARETAKRFNQLYRRMNAHIGDKDHHENRLFPIPKAKIGRVRRLVGIGKPGKNGQLLKMSKSLNNAIFLSDSTDEIRRKIMNMYTDPNRLRTTDPGTIENNPLWIFHDVFNPNKSWIEKAKRLYCEGKIGDVECKEYLVEILSEFLAPLQKRRTEYAADRTYLYKILHRGTERVNAIAEETLRLVKKTICQNYF
ncbi:tryptophan--tRNA ligase [Coxiella endosymbiont of Amblyomma sculptum]|uniref:tryptophan--tRNA ligase n=1 Tax=Coxiella endosymbiont of Amblyomma sculptum TaxID=2487929 RepID=UPI00132F4300|nr:tryptophan--tRNA ligase [Coxiella endosymbiont of Amblyomma sculptum]QHG92649.1 tryptophan--tRNA ligase [Coxiella endosymbiont of Amblyomma sculptum]